jgi:hypothetical protein
MLTIKDGTEIHVGEYKFKIILKQPTRSPIATSFIKGEFINRDLVTDSGVEENEAREIEDGSFKYLKNANWATKNGFDLKGIDEDKGLVIALTDALKKMLDIGIRYGGTIILIDSVAEVPSNLGRAVNIHCSYYI